MTHDFGNALDDWFINDTGVVAPLSDVAFGNGTWVATGGFFDTPRTLIVSSNGTSWQDRSACVPVPPYCLIFANGLFVGGGLGGKISVSAEDCVWSEYDSGLVSGIVGITHFQDMYVVLSQRKGIAVSSNAIDWFVTQNEFGDSVAASITSSGRQIVFVTEYGETFSSTNGVIWTFQQGPLFTQVAFANGVYVGASWGGGIWTANENLAWQFVSESPAYVSSLRIENGVLFATDFDGNIFTSPDATNWLRRIVPKRIAYSPLRGITYGEGRFVAVGQDGTTLTTVLDALALRLCDYDGLEGPCIESTAMPSSSYSVESSTNLWDWASIFSVTNGTGIAIFRHREAAGKSRYFYRLKAAEYPTLAPK